MDSGGQSSNEHKLNHARLYNYYSKILPESVVLEARVRRPTRNDEDEELKVPRPDIYLPPGVVIKASRDYTI